MVRTGEPATTRAPAFVTIACADLIYDSAVISRLQLGDLLATSTKPKPAYNYALLALVLFIDIAVQLRVISDLCSIQDHLQHTRPLSLSITGT